jgi:hypothetical protein
MLPKDATLTSLINDELDKLYRATAGKLLLQVNTLSYSQSGFVQRSLNELDEEVERLETDEKDLKPTNAVLQKTLGEYAKVLLLTQSLIAAMAPTIEDTGISVAPSAVTSKVFINISERLAKSGTNPIKSLGTFTTTLDKMGIPWSVPDVLTVTDKFTSSPAWISRLEKWGQGYADMAEASIKAGLEQGWGPRYTASIMRTYAQNIPQAAAENLTRTLQLTAYREASLAMEAANGRFISKKIRIATLDQRTCLSCVSLHGTDLQPGERVDDHYRGRCSEYYVVPGGPDRPSSMQVDSPSGGRRLVPFQSGEEWFNSLSRERQLMQSSFSKSPGKYNAFLAGNPLSTFVKEHVDDIFGRQIVERSLIDAFGSGAKDFYVK